MAEDGSDDSSSDSEHTSQSENENDDAKSMHKHLFGDVSDTSDSDSKSVTEISKSGNNQSGAAGISKSGNNNQTGVVEISISGNNNEPRIAEISKSGNNNQSEVADMSKSGNNNQLENESKSSSISNNDNSKFKREETQSCSSSSSSSSCSSSDSESGSSSCSSYSRSSHSESDKSKCSSSKTSRKETPTVSKPNKSPSTNFKECYEKHPDVYGIRRSNRSRKPPQRLNLSESDSDPEIKRPNARAAWHSESSSSDYNSDTDQEQPVVRRPLPCYRIRPNLRARPVLKQNKTSRRRKRFSSYEDESAVESEDEPLQRYKSRRRATVSYKEDSEDKTDSDDIVEVECGGESQDGANVDIDNAETIERVIAIRRGKHGVVGNQTTMYAIEENGDPNEGCDVNDLQNTEVQFLIKWKGWSHIHNTWESEDSLKSQKVKGMKKVENFLKRDTDLAYWRKHSTPEDAEYYECQLELQQDLLKTYNFVERIIAKCDTSDSTEYYVKWQSLPYSEATWEDATIIERKWPSEIKEFLEREDSKQTPSKLCRALKYRPKFSQLATQPSYMGNNSAELQLRDYQLHGVNWLIHSWCKENSVILADEMGLGKTIQTICFLSYLFHAHQVYGPNLVVVPLSTMTSWQREFTMWAPEINVVTYIGDVNSRNIIRECEWCFANNPKRLKFNVILTTYEILLKDKAFLGSLSWAVLMVDEAHRLKNDDSLLYKALLEFVTNHRLLITGTPLQNSLKELWALLHFIMPRKFEAWDVFEKDHENAANKGYAKLHKQLEPFILRRVKKDVEKSLPAKVEQILRVEMTAVQKQFYRWILTKNYDALRKGVKGSSSTFLNIVIELKKCCNHSLLIKSDYDPIKHSAVDHLQQLVRGSGKLVLLDKLLMRLRETGHRVLIFSQMVRMLDILAEYLQLRHFPFQRLDGGIKGEIRRQALDHFNAENSQDFCFLLSTRAGGLGINLATADTVIIFDSDWNPQNDLQAQARAHRIGQKNQVNIYRLVTKSSVEEDIVERAKKKMVLDHLVIQRMDTTGRTVLDKKSASTTASTPFNKEELTAILKFGAADLFRDDENADEEPSCDIDEILRRAETRDEAPATVGDELLSAFKMANFVAVEEDTEIKSEPDGDDEVKEWDDIIPDKFRHKVEEEEKAKEIEDLYLPPRNRKKLQVHNYDSEEDNEKRNINKNKDAENDDSSEFITDDEKPRKRGRPRAFSKDLYGGFTDAEIRRFIKSYKKFAVPLKRLEAVACDAELQEKPLQDLRKLCTYLRDNCHNLMKNQKEEIQNEDNTLSASGPGRKKGPSFKIGGVNVNARTLITCEQDLEPLDKLLPADIEERSNWALECRLKPANYDVEWDNSDDSKLLCGIYQYGMGSWEAIKMDPSLNIGDKILANNGSKPQAKHLQARVEYLLKILKKQMNNDGNMIMPRNRKPRKVKERKSSISKEIIEDDSNGEEPLMADDQDKSNSPPTTSKDDGKRKYRKDKTDKDKYRVDNRKKKNNSGPMHFTANSEPRALDVTGDLDPAIFNECKEMMRPVKKSLIALDKPDESLDAQEQVVQTRKCLIEIGDQINKCLAKYKDSGVIKEWRGNLWYFVSKFTEFDPKRLFKLYKHALKKAKENEAGILTDDSPPRKRKMEESRAIENNTPSPIIDRSDDEEHIIQHRPKLKEKNKIRNEKTSNGSSSSRAYSSQKESRSRESKTSPDSRLQPNSSSNRITEATERWPRKRYGSNISSQAPEGKRKRYDSYQRKNYSRDHEREHDRERDRDRDRVRDTANYMRDFNQRMLQDKRRLENVPNAAAFIGAFPPIPYYLADPASSHTFPRDRYSLAGAPFPNEWHPLLDTRDYRREFERRTAPTSNPR